MPHEVWTWTVRASSPERRTKRSSASLAAFVSFWFGDKSARLELLRARIVDDQGTVPSYDQLSVGRCQPWNIVVDKYGHPGCVGSNGNVTSSAKNPFVFQNTLDCWAIFNPKDNLQAIYPVYFRSEREAGRKWCTSQAAWGRLRATTKPSEYETAVFERIGISN